MTHTPADKLTGSINRRLAFAGIIFLSLINTATAHAQAARNTTTPLPSFEVASIKPNHSGGTSSRIDCDLGRCRMTNVAVKILIQRAFNIQGFQLSGGPGWIDSARYDIDAKVDDALTEKMSHMQYDARGALLRQVFQSLLADRFNLKITRTVRELPVYALAVAKNGPKLQATTRNGVHNLHDSRNGGETHIKDEGISMAELAAQLAWYVDRPIVDHTGLSGNYDFTLHFDPRADDQSASTVFKASTLANPDATASPSPDALGPSLFTALPEQLGIKLESTKGPADTLIIDHVDPPSED